MSRPPDHAILYDRDCGFCTRSLDRIMRRDRDGSLRAVAIQSEEGQRLLERGGVPEAERLDSWHLVAPDGTITSAGAAGAPLLRLLPAGGLGATVLGAFPRVTDAVYGWIAAHRDLLGRFLVLALVVMTAGSAGLACGSTVQEGTRLTVYASLPLQDPEGKEALAGVERALADAGGEAGGAPVEIEALDSAGEDLPVQATVAANARLATQDSTSIAYIGELNPATTAFSVPITNEAGLLQVAPGEVPEEVLAQPGGNDPSPGNRAAGERTLGALPAAGADPEALGYEAMAAVLDSVEEAEDPLSRADVLGAFLAISDRESELGTYSIGPDGAADFQP